MKIFNVLEHPDGKPDRVAFIPEGFSWGALLFGLVWALWHRMWVVAALLFVAASLLTIASHLQFLGPGLATLLNLAIGLVFAFEARNLEVMSLERAGFRRSGLIQASNAEAAEIAYFAGRPPFSSEPVSSRPAATQADTLGLFGNV